MLFPELTNKRFGHINLNDESVKWLKANKVGVLDRNLLLDPAYSDQMVRGIHTELGLDFSYGGWLEDRSDKLRDAYMQDSGNFLHLGVDFNVPAGTKVATDEPGLILRIIPNAPEEGGWGTRVILKPDRTDEVIVYGHLSPELRCEEGDWLPTGEIFGKVGDASENGGWFPHLHVQCIDAAYYREELRAGTVEFDGYGHPNDRAKLARLFGDPMRHVSLR